MEKSLKIVIFRVECLHIETSEKYGRIELKLKGKFGLAFCLGEQISKITYISKMLLQAVIKILGITVCFFYWASKVFRSLCDFPRLS